MLCLRTYVNVRGPIQQRSDSASRLEHLLLTQTQFPETHTLRDTAQTNTQACNLALTAVYLRADLTNWQQNRQLTEYIRQLQPQHWPSVTSSSFSDVAQVAAA